MSLPHCATASPSARRRCSRSALVEQNGWGRMKTSAAASRSWSLFAMTLHPWAPTTACNHASSPTRVKCSFLDELSALRFDLLCFAIQFGHPPSDLVSCHALWCSAMPTCLLQPNLVFCRPIWCSAVQYVSLHPVCYNGTSTADATF